MMGSIKLRNYLGLTLNHPEVLASGAGRLERY